MNFKEFLVDEIIINSRATLDRQNDLLRTYIVQVLDGDWSTGTLTNDLVTDPYVLTYLYPVTSGTPQWGDVLIDQPDSSITGGIYSIYAGPWAITGASGKGKGRMAIQPDWLAKQTIMRPKNRKNIERALFVSVNSLPTLANASNNQIYILPDDTVYFVQNGAWRSFGGSGGGSGAYADQVTITGIGNASDPFKVTPSATTGNTIQVKTDGLYVPPALTTVTTDGETISGDGSSANPLAVKISTDSGNALEKGSDDALFVPSGNVEVDGISIYGDGSSTNKLQVRLSGRANNALSIDNDGTNTGLYISGSDVGVASVNADPTETLIEVDNTDTANPLIKSTTKLSDAVDLAESAVQPNALSGIISTTANNALTTSSDNKLFVTLAGLLTDADKTDLEDLINGKPNITTSATFDDGTTDRVLGLNWVSDTKQLVKVTDTDPTDVAGYTLLFDLTDYLAKSGGTMTGTLTLAADPTADLDAATKQYVDAVDTKVSDIQALIPANASTTNTLATLDDRVASSSYDAPTRTLTLTKGDNTTVTQIFPEADSTNAGLMPSSDVATIADLVSKVDSLVSGGVWRGTFDTYADLESAYPSLDVSSTSWNAGDYVIVTADENHDATTKPTTRYVVEVSGSTKTLVFQRVESVNISTATNTTLGVVKGDASTDGKIYVENDGSMSLNGYDAINTSLDDKIDKVSGATVDTIPTFASDGSLNASTYTTDSFATAAQGTLADNAQPKITGVASSTALMVQPSTTGGQPGTRALNTLLLAPTAQTANTQLLVAPSVQGAAPTLKPISDLQPAITSTGSTNLLTAPTAIGGQPGTKAISDLQSAIPASTNGYIATHSGTAGTFGTPINPSTFSKNVQLGLSGGYTTIASMAMALGEGVFHIPQVNYNAMTDRPSGVWASTSGYYLIVSPTASPIGNGNRQITIAAIYANQSAIAVLNTAGAYAVGWQMSVSNTLNTAGLVNISGGTFLTHMCQAMYLQGIPSGAHNVVFCFASNSVSTGSRPRDRYLDYTINAYTCPSFTGNGSSIVVTGKGDFNVTALADGSDNSGVLQEFYSSDANIVLANTTGDNGSTQTWVSSDYFPANTNTMVTGRVIDNAPVMRVRAAGNFGNVAGGTNIVANLFYAGAPITRIVDCGGWWLCPTVGADQSMKIAIGQSVYYYNNPSSIESTAVITSPSNNAYIQLQSIASLPRTSSHTYDVWVDYTIA